MRQLSVLYTGNQQGYSVRYSPFDNSLLACVSCDKFGLTGSSSLYIMKYADNSFLNSKFSIVDSLKCNYSMFDVEWAPIESSLLLTANGDGSVSIWKWPTENDRKPIFNQKQHNKEVYSINWEPSGMRMYHFLSASWDQTIKIWNLSNTGLTFLTSLNDHDSMVYSGSWNPNKSGIIISTSADKTFKIWDVNSNNNSMPLFTSPKSKSDILCCDWNKFDHNLFLLGYASGLIELRDLRNLKNPPIKSIEMAHDYAIRKIRFSPHFSNLFGSISYDMITKLWTTNDGLIEASQNHSEFAYGFDFDSKVPNRLVDCGWDRRVMISEFDLSNKFL